MKNIAAQLESFCREHPIHMDDRETILESLYWLYAESIPTDSEKLRDGYARLRKQLYFLKPKEYDAVFDTVTELCTESEQIAFYAGVRLGAKLIMELRSELSAQNNVNTNPGRPSQQ